MVVIGDELLGGFVEDSNSPWLAARLRDHGVPLTRVHVVPDEMDAIDEALTAELARSRPRVVVTSGGLGSTPDDITYEAVAASLGRELVVDPVLAAHMDTIVERTREHGLDVDEVFVDLLMRMARVPAGSRVLTDGDSWVPAVAVDVDGGSDEQGVTIVVLPGVPSAFRRLVERVVEPAMLADRNPVPTVVELTHSFPESVLNATFAELLERFPQVRLGSYPGTPMLVRLSGPDEPVEEARRFVASAIDALTASPAGRRLADAWTRRPVVTDDEDAT
ncbi:MAG: molybdopterin-binding protein [Nitriliruptoraceae bacterium]